MIREISKKVLEEAYHREENGDVKERLLLVMRVRSDGLTASEASKELHRTRGWASKWLKRFEEEEEGVDGLKTKGRSGRPPKLDHNTFVRMKRRIVRNERGWTVKEVREMIRSKTDVVYSERQIYRLLQRWGARTVVPEKRLLHKASREERLAFKKEM